MHPDGRGVGAVHAVHAGHGGGAEVDWRARAEEAEETLRSIRAGGVDALVVQTSDGDRVFTLRGADEPYRIMLEQMSEGAVSLSADRIVVYANRRFASLVGAPLSAVIGAPVEQFIAPERWDGLAKLFVAGPDSGRRSGEFTLRTAVGPRIDAQLSVTALPEETGANWCMVVTDITEQKDVQIELEGTVRDRSRALRQADRRYQQIVETASEGVWTVDRSLRTTFVNQALARMLGYQPAEMVGRPVTDFLDPALVGQANTEIGRHLLGESGQRDVRLLSRDGQLIWVIISAGPLVDEDGTTNGALALVTDISERKRMESRMRDLADHDSLTGIFNRRRLMEELDGRLRDPTRWRHSLAVVMLDVDNFKFVNDTYGHATGDSVLRAVARTLQGRIRNSDTVARLGGDEFALILQDVREDEALQVARDLARLLSEVDVGPPISASFGIAPISGAAEITADEALVYADSALYDAKEHGGDRAEVYMGRVSGSVSWVQQIRGALDDDRFVLYAQPIVALATGRLSHHELLVRMLGEDEKVISPAAFIPAAERFGLIHEIDRWVVGEGMRIARTRPVAINLSGYSIDQEAVTASVRNEIAGGLRPDHLMFEITETAAMTNLAAARALVTELQDMGCSVALDDFGTGFGSFSYLKYIPARYLKIDMEFVRDVAVDSTDRQIVKSIVDIAHNLGKVTVAEGVESAEAFEVVKHLGVDLAQGYFIGRPGPCCEGSELSC